MAGVIAVMTVVAFLDVLFQRYQHTKKLRMTKQEVKDEFKQLEGDPQVKARLRQIRMEKARQRMMAAVPEADVVVTNPTHYAVALKYEHGTMEVPVLLAKGTDAVAQRIRALAEEHAIPLVENPPLARTLFATVDIDEEIPPEHYQAVAEVIGYVMRLRRSGITSPSSAGRTSASRRSSTGCWGRIASSSTISRVPRGTAWRCRSRETGGTTCWSTQRV